MAFLPQQNVLVCLSLSGDVYTINPYTGELLWKSYFNAGKIDPENFMDILKSTADSATQSFIAVTGQQISSINTSNGQEIWSHQFKVITNLKSMKMYSFKENSDDRVMLELKYTDHKEFICLRRSDGALYYRFVGRDMPITARSSTLDLQQGASRLDAYSANGDFYFNTSDELIRIPNSDTLLFVLFDKVNLKPHWVKKIPARTKPEQGNTLAAKTNGTHIAVVLGALMVFDAKKGTLKVQKKFDNSDLSISLTLTAHHYYGVAAYEMDDSSLYYTDRDIKTIRKVDLETGKTKWISPEFPKSQVYPMMVSTPHGLLIQAGGLVEHKWIETKSMGMGMSMSFDRSDYEFRGENPNFIMLDKAKGTIKWKGKIKQGQKHLSNSVWSKDKTSLYSADSKTIYGFTIASGDTFFL